MQTAGIRPEPEQLRLALCVESGYQKRTIGERLRSSGVFQDQVFVTAQQRDAVDSLRNISQPIVIDGSSVRRPGEDCDVAALAAVCEDRPVAAFGFHHGHLGVAAVERLKREQAPVGGEPGIESRFRAAQDSTRPLRRRGRVPKNSAARHARRDQHQRYCGDHRSLAPRRRSGE